MKELQPVDGFTVGHLSIITAYTHKIGIVDIINTLVPTQMAIDAGTVIFGMVPKRCNHYDGGVSY